MKGRSLWRLAILFPLIPILVGLGVFIYPRFSIYSDLTISHLPNAVYILHTIRDFGVIPLWSDLLMGGYPLSADPLSGIWYPPNWIGILLPAPWGFNILSALHLFWGGLGMAAFLTQSGLKRAAAIFGGIAFAAMPKIFAHLALGHVSLVYSFTWLPWLLAAESYRTSSDANRRKCAVLPGVILGLIALADVRGAFYAGVLYFCFWLWNSLSTNSGRLTWGSALRKIGGFAAQAALGLGVAAVLLLPLIQLTSLSTRVSLTGADSLVFSLPFKKILNLFVPEFGGYAEWIVYPGAAVVFLIILALATRVLRKRLVFWLVVIAVSLVLSFGSNLPFMAWFGSTPVAGLLRVSPRWMFIAGFAMVVVASHAFHELISGYKRPKFDPIFSMVAICAFLIVLILGSIVIKADVGMNMFWGTASLIFVVLLIALAERGRLSSSALLIIFPAFILIDLVGVNWQSIQYRPTDVVFQEGSPVIEELQKDTGLYRVYSPSYAIPQLSAARADIEMVSAINPLQLADYSSWMLAASGASSLGYSVAVPPLSDTDLFNSNRSNQIDAEKLGLLNVKYVISNYAIANSELIEKWSDNSAWVYENRQVMPRAWVETVSANGQKITAPANMLQLQPGEIIIEAEGPGNLVLSEVGYPGWTAKIDRVEAPILRIANLLLGVTLSSGSHQVEFVYQPTLQYVGIGLSLAAWGLFGFITLRKRQP